MFYSPKQLASALVDLNESHGAKKAADVLVQFLAQQRELALVRDVVESVEQSWKERYGAATVRIETSHPLTVSLKKRIKDISHGVELQEVANLNMIGGARIRIDDRVIDGSLQGMLEHLKQHLMTDI